MISIRLAIAVLLSLALACQTYTSEAAEISFDETLEDTPTMIVVVGAIGAEEFREPLAAAANRLQLLCEGANITHHCIGLSQKTSASSQTTNVSTVEQDSDQAQLERLLEKSKTESTRPLWLVLLGHGTFDGKVAKFNLKGPDLDASKLSKWLEGYPREIILINCSSASAPFINRVSGGSRIIITSTRSGFEQNYCRFGTYFCEALSAPEADLDKDSQTSLLESFLFASRRVSEFYSEGERLQTEHALIDDNGDQLGTSPDWFQGVRVTRKSKNQGIPDGFRAHQIHLVQSEAESRLTNSQRDERDRLELELENLRTERDTMERVEYFARLDQLVGRLAKFYSEVGPSNADGSMLVPPEGNSVPPRPRIQD